MTCVQLSRRGLPVMEACRLCPRAHGVRTCRPRAQGVPAPHPPALPSEEERRLQRAARPPSRQRRRGAAAAARHARCAHLAVEHDGKGLRGLFQSEAVAHADRHVAVAVQAGHLFQAPPAADGEQRAGVGQRAEACTQRVFRGGGQAQALLLHCGPARPQAAGAASMAGCGCQISSSRAASSKLYSSEVGRRARERA
jgi:hypothetical protein